MSKVRSCNFQVNYALHDFQKAIPPNIKKDLMWNEEKYCLIKLLSVCNYNGI